MIQLEIKAPYILSLLIFFLTMHSCVGHRDLITLNGAEMEMERGLDKLYSAEALQVPKAFKIQPSDLLIINISAFEGNTAEFLQQEFSSKNLNSGGSRDFGPDALYYNSYQVDDEGYIELPLIDRMMARGLSTYQLKTKLDSAYTPFLKFASTSVKLANMKVTLLGEVESPGVYYFFNNQTTILEAISLAGDFSDFGNRRKVKLIRRSGKESQTIILDLNTPDFIGTEYYYIKPNDLIYIEPIKAKARDVGAQSVGIVLTAISTAALLANIFLDINKK